MTKKFIIEQCRRLKIAHRQESEEVERQNRKNEKWLIPHNKGHEELIDKFIEQFDGWDNDNLDKKLCKKWLRKNIKKANVIIKDISKKYNDFESDDDILSKNDEKLYYINDGIDCMAKTLIMIINKKMYISK
ncbi:hypothetical protein [Clostridium botulinum]|uniref:Transporter n=2 Tax=Clostridium botulinum TaxID=1491 RepID=A0A9Q1ZDC2_CLOBO|nr:hypothetical protein [Clostridium botulinum]AEB76035.1 transporter, putative [Clostridium botulinum BKT015925]KEI02438.1 transporter [Clostridium botulinum D str. 16868]KEI04092.1 transporter [Clostridium botulinum C/D str. Sp77]KLU75729.1 transporter [Clostridium botulinum V891]KOA74820.1 transporter [Clostridium botulinum]